MCFEVTAASGEMFLDKLWISNYSMNGLFAIDLETNKTEFYGFFPNEKIDIQMLHRWTFLIDGKVFFIPFSGDNIHIFDGDEIESIYIGKKKNEDAFVCSGAVYDEANSYIYIIPMDNEHDLIRFDTVTYKIEVIDNFSESLKSIDSYFENMSYVIQISNVYLYGSELLFLYGYRWLVKWDIAHGKMDYQLVSESRSNMAYNVFPQESFVDIAYQNGDYIRFKKDNNKKNIRFNYGVGDMHFPMKSYKLGAYEYFYYDRVDKIIKVDEKDEVTDLFEPTNFKNSNMESGFGEFLECKNVGDKVFLFSPSKRGYISMNTFGELEQILIDYDISSIRNIYLNKLTQNGFLTEYRVCLSDYLSFIDEKG